MKDVHRLQSSLIRLSARAERVSPSMDDSGENERMYNATEDLYILYIEEIQSINAVYTILSSRPQSFLASFSALCTIPHSAACISPAVLIHCALHKSYSLCLLPLPGKRGIAPAITTPSASKDSALLNPCLPRRWMPPGRLHPRCPGGMVGPWRGAGIAPGPMEGWRPGQAGAVAWTAGRWDS